MARLQVVVFYKGSRDVGCVNLGVGIRNAFFGEGVGEAGELGWWEAAKG